jgi:hypothetical protein
MPASSYRAPDRPELGKFLEALDFGDRTDEHQSRRNTLWSSWDQNANGWLSLAEVDDAIKSTIRTDLRKRGEKDANGVAEDIWRRYRPSFIRAFNNAKDAHEGSDKRDDDYVSKEEFRLLVTYLQYYAIWFECFMLIDISSDGKALSDADHSDRRIDVKEWTKGVAKVRAAGSSWAPFTALKRASEQDFAKIDTNHGGYITLTEWCAWLESAEKKAGSQAGKDLAVGDGRKKKKGGNQLMSSLCVIS